MSQSSPDRALTEALEHHKSGRLTEAEDLYRRVLAADKDHPDALHLLGLIAYQTGNLQIADSLIAKAIEKNNNVAIFHSNYGNVLKDLGLHEKAIASYDRALQLEPSSALVLSNRGATLHDLGRIDEALASIDAALQNEPNYPDAHFNRANVLRDLGRIEEALEAYNATLKIQPDHVKSLCNRGNILRDLGQLEDALACYDAALMISPSYIEVIVNRGSIFSDLGLFQKALESFNAALSTKPDLVEALSNRGSALANIGHIKEAEDSLRRALELKPNYVQAHSNLLMSLNYSESISPQEALAEARSLGLALSSRSVPKFACWPFLSSSKKIRVGFVSGDFSKPVMGCFIEGVVRNLNHDLFDLVAIPTRSEMNKSAERIKTFFHEWLPIYGLNDYDAARLIHQKTIHVLLDLSGHTDNNRLAVFSFKPAPVQVSWLGYPNTTGIPEIDYRIVDAITDPPPMFNDFATEKLVRLEGCFLCYKPFSDAPPLEVRPQTRPPVFGSANNFSKIGASTLRLWAGVLGAIPSSTLELKSGRLFDDPIKCEFVRSVFASYGIEPERLLFHGYANSTREHLSFYNRIDIALDPLNYNGTITTCEALWMGVPVVTLAGDRHAARVGASLMTAAGQTDLIVSDTNEYTEKAISLVADRGSLSTRRKRQRERLIESPLLNDVRFAERFGAMLLKLYNDHQFLSR